VHRTVSSNAKMYEGVVHCEAAIMAALSCDDITPQSLKESFLTPREEVGVLLGSSFSMHTESNYKTSWRPRH
jgi:hypothetical protein